MTTVQDATDIGTARARAALLALELVDTAPSDDDAITICAKARGLRIYITSRDTEADTLAVFEAWRNHLNGNLPDRGYHAPGGGGYLLTSVGEYKGVPFVLNASVYPSMIEGATR